MAFVAGKGSAFKLDNSAGTLTDLSQYCDSVEFSTPIDTLETTTFGDAAKDFVVGLKDGTVSLGGKWDATLDAHMNGIYGGISGGATTTFEVHPAGTGSGTPKYSGECYLTSYQVSSGVADLVTWSAELQVSGAITRGTNP